MRGGPWGAPASSPNCLLQQQQGLSKTLEGARGPQELRLHPPERLPQGSLHPQTLNPKP